MHSAGVRFHPAGRREGGKVNPCCTVVRFQVNAAAEGVDPGGIGMHLQREPALHVPDCHCARRPKQEHVLGGSDLWPAGIGGVVAAQGGGDPVGHLGTIPRGDVDAAAAVSDLDAAATGKRYGVTPHPGRRRLGGGRLG